MVTGRRIRTKLDLQWTKPGYRRRQAIALDKYDHLTTDLRERWEMEARGHDEQQPLIKSRIIEMLKRNPKISWESLELAIDRKWPPHMFKLTGLQTKLSKQKAITNFLAQVGTSIVGSETISNYRKWY
jgi:hypothetical protein